MSGHERRWNHNTHYYPLILAAVPDGCLRALDVGCGEGLLTRELAVRVPEVVGIDNDEPSIALAREQGPEGRAEYVLGDFLGYPFPAASFGLVSCVAALHHMDPAAALTRMAELLTPGGVLVVNGVARPAPRDLPLDLAAVVANLGYRAARGYWHHPVAGRVAAAAHLPGDQGPGRGPSARRPLPPSPAVALLAHLDQARRVRAVRRRLGARSVLRSAVPCTSADMRR